MKTIETIYKELLLIDSHAEKGGLINQTGDYEKHYSLSTIEKLVNLLDKKKILSLYSFNKVRIHLPHITVTIYIKQK